MTLSFRYPARNHRIYNSQQQKKRQTYVKIILYYEKCFEYLLKISHLSEKTSCSYDRERQPRLKKQKEQYRPLCSFSKDNGCAIASKNDISVSSYFKFELSSFPFLLFDSHCNRRNAYKTELAKSIAVMSKYDPEKEGIEIKSEMKKVVYG